MAKPGRCFSLSALGMLSLQGPLRWRSARRAFVAKGPVPDVTGGCAAVPAVRGWARNSFLPQFL